MLDTAVKLMNLPDYKIGFMDMFDKVEDADEAAAAFMRAKMDEVVIKRLTSDDSDFDTALRPGELMVNGCTVANYEELPSDYYINFISLLSKNVYDNLVSLFEDKLGSYEYVRLYSEYVSEFFYEATFESYQELSDELIAHEDDIMHDCLGDCTEFAHLFPKLAESIMEISENYDDGSELYAHCIKSQMIGWFKQKEDDGTKEYATIKKAVDVFCGCFNDGCSLLKDGCFYGYFTTGSEGPDMYYEFPFTFEPCEIGAILVLSMLLPAYYEKEGNNNACT